MLARLENSAAYPACFVFYSNGYWPPEPGNGTGLDLAVYRFSSGLDDALGKYVPQLPAFKTDPAAFASGLGFGNLAVPEPVVDKQVREQVGCNLFLLLVGVEDYLPFL